LLVRGVEEDSPAAKAGIKEGDLIVEAGSRPLSTADDLFAALDEAKGSIDLKILRGVESKTITVGFGQ
jgi:S1-C subfamily serine protease